jgi:hypothetical protein
MTRRDFLALAASAPLALRAQSSGDSLGAARDLLYQALELLSVRSSADDIQRAVRFLRAALDQNPSYGDAHYYRAKCLEKLGRKQDTNLIKSDLSAAQRYGSEALQERRDPFFVASPRINDNLAAVGTKWALVVGVSRFQPETGAEPLSFAAADATSFADVLKDPAVGRFPANQVFLLTNQQATTAAIKARLNTIATRAKPEDVVVVYISTHGSPRSDDLRRVSYLYTYDTDVTSRDQIFGSALAMVEISSIISTRCVAQRTVVIFDTCHSGAGAASQALSREDFLQLSEGAGRYILTSCEENQKSYEDRGHGLFTASLIANLRARRGCVPLNDLFTAVRQDVAAKARQGYKKDQRPVMTSSANAAPVILGAPVGPGGIQCTASA